MFKLSLLKPCVKVVVFTFLVLWLILVHIFIPKKDKACCPIFVFRKGISNANICDVVLYLLYEGWRYIDIRWYNPVPQFKNNSCNARFYSFNKPGANFFSEMNRIYLRGGSNQNGVELTHFRPMFHLCRNQLVDFY